MDTLQAGAANLWHRCHKWLGQSLCLVHRKSRRAQASQWQIRQEAERAAVCAGITGLGAESTAAEASKQKAKQQI